MPWRLRVGTAVSALPSAEYLFLSQCIELMVGLMLVFGVSVSLLYSLLNAQRQEQCPVHKGSTNTSE